MKNLRTAFSTRQYMLNNDFEIFYYSDKDIKGIGNHAHTYYEFLFFLSGNLNYNVEGKSYTIEPGDMILLPPGVHHYSEIHNFDVPYNRFVFWITPEYVSHLLEISPDLGYVMQHVVTSKKYIYHFDVFTLNALQSKLSSLIAELNSNRFAKGAGVYLLVADLVFNINRAVYELEHDYEGHEDASLYQNILMYISDHLDEELTLDSISSAFFVSKYHVSHIFKENTGISLHSYITKQRLKAAEAAIKNHTELTDVVSLCGFSDYSTFFRAFKKEYGLSPSEYRTQNLTAPSLHH